MAVISELVRTVAQVEKLEENFVSVYARSAREAGYISHHGRGKNAAQMLSRDATNLLIAVNASDLAKNAPETISTYRDLPIIMDRFLPNENKYSLSNICHENSSFGEVLDALILLCVASSDDDDLLGAAIYDGIGFPKGGATKSEIVSRIDSIVSMRISFFRPKAGVIISFRDKSNSELGGARFGSDEPLFDVERLVSITISQKTLRAVGSVLRL